MPTPRIRTVEGSCWPCKERRVICDLTPGSCGKCAKIGRKCDYGKVRLRWTDCVASRGKLAGRKVPLNPLFQPTLQRNQGHHLLYFERELLPRFNLANTVPLLDLKILACDPILLQSAVAVANAHQTYAYRTPDKKASLILIQDRNNALRIFRKHLMAAQGEEVHSSLFIANVLLCILDGIIEPSPESTASHYHIMGGKAILKHWGGVKAIFEAKTELPILMLSIFASIDLTHATLIGDETYFEASFWADFGGHEAWWGSVQPQDDFLETMSIISQLAALGHGVLDRKDVVPIDKLLAIQQCLDQQVSRQLELNTKDPNVLAWAAFTSAWRFSASVYLYRALSGLEVGHPLVQKSVASCMDVVGGGQLTSKLHHCILFPLLVVGAHSLDPGQRAVTLESITISSAYLSFEGLRSLTSYLEKRWEMLDDKTSSLHQMSWWAYFEDIAFESCLF